VVTESRGGRRVRRLALPGLIGLALLVGACTSSGAGTSQAPPVRQMASIATLRDAFNADPGATRLILLVSPT
jgi:hypothetical protein